MVDIHDIHRMSDIIRIQFHPDKIILFGSYARGDATEDSDVDLLVVMETKERMNRRALSIRKALWGFSVPKDILVRTPREFQERSNQSWNILYFVAHEGKVLYEREA
jgi:predicted nucleotidyltransferase